MLARHLADAIGGYGRAVSERFVVKPCQRVDEIEVVASDDFELVVGVITFRHLLSKGGFIETRVIETNGTGVNGRV